MSEAEPERQADIGRSRPNEGAGRQRGEERKTERTFSPRRRCSSLSPSNRSQYSLGKSCCVAPLMDVGSKNHAKAYSHFNIATLPLCPNTSQVASRGACPGETHPHIFFANSGSR